MLCLFVCSSCIWNPQIYYGHRNIFLLFLCLCAYLCGISYAIMNVLEYDAITLTSNKYKKKQWKDTLLNTWLYGCCYIMVLFRLYFFSPILLLISIWDRLFLCLYCGVQWPDLGWYTTYTLNWVHIHTYVCTFNHIKLTCGA